MIVEADVFTEIGNLEQIAALDGVGAKSHLTRRFGHGHAHLAFKPLAFGIDQRDQCDGCAANLGGEPGEVVKLRLGRGIENVVTPQRDETLGFIGGNGRELHQPGWVKTAWLKNP